MSKIKICGITNLDDAIIADVYGADYLGFIFTQQSPRTITPQIAKTIIAQLKDIKTVGVFIEQSDEEILAIKNYCGLDFVQIYRETFLDKEFVIRAITINENLLEPNKTQFILIDSFSNHQKGGTGQSFDWQLLPKDLTHCFVAGGINENNILHLISHYRPYAVDICSSVESYPGKKDTKKLIYLLEKVKTL